VFSDKKNANANVKGKKMSNKPNIVFFFTDDQRFDTIAALGNSMIHTPNIDKLVGRGVSFTQACIPGGTSGAVCMPSRAMLNTGRTLFHLNGAGESIPKSHTTIGECLQKAGYRTYGSGKWHNGPDAFARSFTDGAEIFFGGMADHWNVPCYDFDPTGKYDKTCVEIKEPLWNKDINVRRCDHISTGKHSTDIIAEAASDFIGKYDDEAPLYMYLSFLAPHDPRSMPQEFLDIYNVDEIQLPPNFMGAHPFNNGCLHIRDEELAPFPRDPDDTRQQILEYYAMISHVDARIGDVMKSLEAKGMLEDTIIIFAADNGLAVGQHGLFGKQSCYEHSIRVPLIFAGPGIPEDVTTDAFAYLFDIFPTLCDLTGTPKPATVEGKSLAGILQDLTQSVRPFTYHAYTELHRAVRTGKYKLIEYVVDGKHTITQLFDLESDPAELDNLAYYGEYAELVADLREELVSLADEWDDEKSEWGEKFWSRYPKQH
jgi:arylsulfatase A-like enzyme